MKTPVYIVGAGGFGREVYAWLLDVIDSGQDWEVAGFLDDNTGALDGFNYPVSVVGTVSEHVVQSGAWYVCGIGAVKTKRRVCQPLLEAGARFLTVVHPSAVLGPNVVLGAGVVICPQVTLTCDIEIGAMSMVNCNASAGHDAKIGPWVTVSAHCDLTGHTRVDEGAFLGSRVTVIPGKHVGAGAVVGAGSVVIRNVQAGDSVFGNPARTFA